MRKVGRVGEVAEGREPVLALRGGSRRGDQGKNEDRAAADRSPWLVLASHQNFDGPGNGSASFASNHQTCRKPGVSPGSTFGWP
jgi:hypothetical protein